MTSTNEWIAFNRVVEWKLIRSWLPRECALSSNDLWFKKCYRGRYVITGPGDSIVDDIYLCANQFILQKLKGNIK